jgi:hypothetical protein
MHIEGCFEEEEYGMNELWNNYEQQEDAYRTRE